MIRELRTSFITVLAACSGFACSSGESDPGELGDTPNETANETASKNGDDGCPVNSGFAGDDHCILAPPEGIQLHYGPSDYDNPDEVAQFILGPGEEVNECFFLKLPNETDLQYQRSELRFREGTHHIIVRALEDRTEADGFQNCEGAATSLATDVIGGTGSGNEYVFPPADAGYDGLYGVIKPGTQGMLNGHYINTTEEPILQEFWLNYEPATNPVTRFDGINLYGGLSYYIEPGVHQTYTYNCATDRDIRILSLNAHIHAHSERLSAWKVAADGTRTLLIEEFSWEEPQDFRFDTVTMNPTPDRDLRISGAASGEVFLMAGESIEWECDINNTSDGVLKFRNEVNTGEMCIVGGMQHALDGNTATFMCSRN